MNILVADDEREIVELIELYLSKENYNIIKAYDGMEAYNKFGEEKIDLAILDIMMPLLDGFQLIKRIREKYNTPVIILSAKSEDMDKILGLGLGADDYMTKPFNPLELTARVQAQLRRYHKLGPSAELKEKSVIEIGDIVLDEDGMTASKGDKQLDLTSKEFKILYLLMKNQGKVYTKKQIFEYVWEDNYYNDDNVVMVHLSNLRDKIEDNPKTPVYIKTIRGLGYKFSGG
ncbi:MAG: response regulator transcription factor [Thermodesulfovibrionales bacterium]|nr:response regulator transcription factor [Thermodesulfovibrionales bacterium]